MGNVRNEIADGAVARAQVYGLLATIFRAEPEEALLDEIKAPRFSGVLKNLGVNLGDEFYAVPSPQLVEDLAIEYTKLFVGPGPHISPHESIFIETEAGSGGLWGAVTVKVKKFIETAGFDYTSEFTGMPDHVSVEMEFMQKLATTEADKRASGETKEADWCLGVQKRFLDDHLSRWVPEFCDQVVENSTMRFYSEMAALTKAFLIYDENFLEEKLSVAA